MTEPTAIDVRNLEASFHIGSVQNLHNFPGNKGWMIAKTSDGGSVFDVGTIFEIEGSGNCRALFRHEFYRKLSLPETWDEKGLTYGLSASTISFIKEELAKAQQAGMPTHHVGMIDEKTGSLITNDTPDNPSTCNVVRRFPVPAPKRIEVNERYLWDYSCMEEIGSTNVIPLEVIVRFGFTPQSSLYKKYSNLDDKEASKFAKSLGIEEGILDPWKQLESPVVDFTSKYEDTDRMLNWQEAFLISGLNESSFRELVAKSILNALALRSVFNELGLSLWDLKWEFAQDDGEIVLVDTIDTDSVRATLEIEESVVHLNKQSIRNYYEICEKDWINDIKQAKKDALGLGVDFSSLLQERQGSQKATATPVIHKEFSMIHQERMELIQAYLRGKTSIEKSKLALHENAQKEINFYKNQSLSNDYLALNSI